MCVLCVCVDTGQRRSLQTRLGGEEEPETFVPGIEISSRDRPGGCEGRMVRNDTEEQK